MAPRSKPSGETPKQREERELLENARKNPTARRGMIVHEIKLAMSHGRRVELVAGSRYSATGEVVRVEQDGRKLAEVLPGDSTLVAVVKVAHTAELMRVPIAEVTEVKPSL